MVGVIIASHGKLAEALLGAAESMVGPLAHVAAVSVHASETCSMGKQLADAIDALDEGQGVLVLCDVFGGSPSQAACALLSDPRVEVVSGVNLPMVVKLSTAREGATAFELAKLLTGYGQKNVVHASEHVRQLTR